MLENKIIAVLEAESDLFSDEIIERVSGFSIGEIKVALAHMVNSGIIRMKEDATEHAYFYCLSVPTLPADLQGL